MICQNCRDAGDSNAIAISHVDTKLRQDWEGRAKALHALCKHIDCFCQHRLGELVKK
jgi:hypothetical protein